MIRPARIRQSKKAMLTTGIAVIGILGISGGIIWAISANHGTVLDATSQNPAKPVHNLELNGKMIKFDYLSLYSLETLKAADNDLERYNFAAHGNFEKHFTAVVSGLDGGVINNSGAYTSRVLRSDLYSERDISVDGSLAFEFTKADTTEHTIFIPHGGRIATFSFVSTSRYDDIDAEITNILSSFRWKG